MRAAAGEEPGAVTLREQVNRSDLNSDQFAQRLVERIGWALLDAEDVEESAEHVGRTPNGARQEDLSRCDLPAHREPLYLD